MAIKNFSATVTEPSRVDVVVRQLSGVSHSQVRGLFDHDCVSINAVACEDAAVQVAVGDIVLIRYDPNQRYREKKRARLDRTFKIIFEDARLIVVEKMAGTLTVPTDRGGSNSLIQRVSLYLNHGSKKTSAFAVHRLDREVSGVLVFGKSKQMADKLIEQFRNRKPTRLYVAIVAGRMSEKKGTFESHLATGKNLSRYSTRQSKETELAITHFKVIKVFEDTTVVEVQLESGKRNQIRVHFAEAGHPVMGDERYRPELSLHPHWRLKRIALHAKTLGILHPVTGEQLLFESPIPVEMDNFISRQR